MALRGEIRLKIASRFRIHGLHAFQIWKAGSLEVFLASECRGRGRAFIHSCRLFWLANGRILSRPSAPKPSHCWYPSLVARRKRGRHWLRKRLCRFVLRP